MTTDHLYSRQIAVLNAEGAKAVIEAAISSAAAKGQSMCVAVVDRAGTLQAFHRMDNTPVVAVEVSQGKARAAAQFGAPSKLFQDMVDGGMPSFLSVSSITPLQGGLPLILGGVVVGGIGCSGAAPDQDEEAAQAGASVLS